jgi:NAD(P)-dependent dehydrogenase (short-subunit alcohol dehydrogenase family)
MDRNVAVVTGADRGLGFALCAGLLEAGWQVFAGRYMPEWPALDDLKTAFPDQLILIPLDVASEASVQAAAELVKAATPRVDLLINDAGINPRSYELSIREGQNYADIHQMYGVNAVGPVRVVEAFLPLLDDSAIKRLCFVSSEAGSIARSHRKAWFGYCMSKSALNMAVSILFNDLRSEGFTFRLYHPGWIRSYMRGVKSTVGDMEPEEAGIPALAFFLSGLEGCPPADPPYDEDRLALRDWQSQEWPW